tara:strand:- start:52 stop:732 length:681 start_codon:yes stop_codon:yes gene_type:complete
MIILLGSSSGIGKKLLGQLSKIDEILALYNHNKPDINISNVYLEKIDITKIEQIQNIIEKYNSKLTKITFINLVATTLDKLVPDINKEDVTKTFETNIFSNIYFAKFLTKKMVNDKWGRFIFFSSSKAVKGDVGISVYASSKSSLIGFSNSLSKEYSRFNITSNVISLGYFEGASWNRLNIEKQKELLKEVPSKKIGNVNNIYNAIELLIKSDYITGSQIYIDGGI